MDKIAPFGFSMDFLSEIHRFQNRKFKAMTTENAPKPQIAPINTTGMVFLGLVIFFSGISQGAKRTNSMVLLLLKSSSSFSSEEFLRFNISSPISNMHSDAMGLYAYPLQLQFFKQIFSQESLVLPSIDVLFLPSTNAFPNP
eukprot:Gb_06122 [translate_table: standard]